MRTNEQRAADLMAILNLYYEGSPRKQVTDLLADVMHLTITGFDDGERLGTCWVDAKNHYTKETQDETPTNG